MALALLYRAVEDDESKSRFTVESDGLKRCQRAKCQIV